MKRGLNYLVTNKCLYVVATPIGNLKEMTSRALEILNEMDYIACEDTRNSLKLLTHFDIHKNLISCHEHNEISSSKKIIDLILDGKKVAYISDAGYPLISDPGSKLVSLALENDINIIPISGSNAMLLALVGSGLNTDRFYFHGFLDAKESVRLEELRNLQKKKETLVFYESPHRIDKTLKDLYLIFGNRRACIARELTKTHEEFIRGNLEEFISIDKETLKGEMVIVTEGNNEEIKDIISDEDILKYVKNLTDSGMSTKDAIHEASNNLKVKKNYIYKLYHIS